MPHVKKRVKTRERQDGTTVSTTVYQAVWREHANGADRTKEFRRKGDAERFLVDVQHRLMTGAYTDPVLGRTPFREVAERYLSLGVWKPKSRQTATEKLRYAIDKFGDRPIASIRKGDVQALISELGDVLAPSTIRIVRQHVGGTFTRAIDDKLIVANPAVGVRLPRVETPSVVPLTAEQVQLLLDAADLWYRVAVVIGAGLGLRSSEAAGLTVDRIDFLRRTTRVDRQWQQATQKTAGGFTTTKTRASNRVIPTSQWVLDEIAAHLARRPAGQHGGIVTPDGQHGGIVTPDGQPLDAARWGYYFRRARKRAGLNDSITFHDLRHFFASVLIASGCSIKQVQTALGHDSARITLDTYAHLIPGDEDRVRDAIDHLPMAMTAEVVRSPKLATRVDIRSGKIKGR
jgi:integrase